MLYYNMDGNKDTMEMSHRGSASISIILGKLWDIHTGKIEEVMLIKSPADLEHFKVMYGIDEEIAKEY